MASTSACEQLDRSIDKMFAGSMDTIATEDSSIRNLLEIASALRNLPCDGFKTRLRAELVGGQQRAVVLSFPAATEKRPELLSTAVGLVSTYPFQRRTVAVSLAVHAAAIAIMLSSSLLLVDRREVMTTNIMTLAEPELSGPSWSPNRLGGGGGGGDQDKVAAPNGALPRAARDQFTPPMIVKRNSDARLPMEPTVIAPPDLQTATLRQTGDPLARIFSPPSNGTGTGGGIGSGSGGGVGEGRGPGFGPGWGGGFGGGIYRVGGGVSAPRAIYDPDPEYSDEARRAKYQGSVILQLVVAPDGRARHVTVQRSLGMGLDEKAVEAVRRWRFAPAMKDDQPVAVLVNVEVNFRLH